MSKDNIEMPKVMLVAVVIFVTVIIYLLLVMLGGGLIGALGIFALFLVVMYNILTSTEYMGVIRRNAKVISKSSGAIGVLAEEPHHIGSGIYKAVVTVKKNMIPVGVKQKYLSGFAGLKAFLTGTVHIEIRGKESDYYWIPKKYAISEGALLYSYDFDSTTKFDNETEEMKELQHMLKLQSDRELKFANRLSMYRSQLSSMSGDNKKDIQEVGEIITKIVSEIQPMRSIEDLQIRPRGAKYD